MGSWEWTWIYLDKLWWVSLRVLNLAVSPILFCGASPSCISDGINFSQLEDCIMASILLGKKSREKEQKNGKWAPGIIKNKVLNWKFHSKNKNKNSGTISGKSVELHIPSGNIVYFKTALQRKSWHIWIYMSLVFSKPKRQDKRKRERDVMTWFVYKKEQVQLKYVFVIQL